MAEGAPANGLDANRGPGSRLLDWRAVAVNAWIAAAILAFFVIRILDSNTVRRILHTLAHSLAAH